MRPDALNSVIGRELATGQQLRTALIRSISECEIDSATASTKATRLIALLQEAVTYLQTFDEVAAPTVSTRTQAFGVPTIVVTCSEGLDPDVSIPLTAFVISSPSRTVTGVEIRGNQIRISYSGATLVTADTPDLAYTQPTNVADRVRDAAGNQLASFVAAPVTVAAS